MSSETVLWGLVVALLLAVALLALLVVSLLRSYALVVRTLHDAGISSDGGPREQMLELSRPAEREDKAAPPVVGDTLDGGARALSLSGGEGMLLLAFLSSGCGSCQEFWRTLRGSEGRLPGLEAPVVVVTKGPSREEPGKLAELTADRVELIMSDETWGAYDIPLTPHFVLVNRSTGAIVGEGSTSEPKALADLMARAAADARNITRRELLGGGRPE